MILLDHLNDLNLAEKNCLNKWIGNQFILTNLLSLL